MTPLRSLTRHKGSQLFSAGVILFWKGGKIISLEWYLFVVDLFTWTVKVFITTKDNTFIFSSPELCIGWAVVIKFCLSSVHLFLCPPINIFKLFLWSRSANMFLAHLSRRLKVSFCDHSPSVIVRLSLVGPLSKLFKWFRSIAYLGHRS